MFTVVCSQSITATQSQSLTCYYQTVPCKITVLLVYEFWAHYDWTCIYNQHSFELGRSFNEALPQTIPISYLYINTFRLWYSGTLKWYIKRKEYIPMEILRKATLKISVVTHGAVPFLRRCQLCSYSRTSQHFIESFTSPCRRSYWSSPYHSTLSL
jgi:hypothetical protein